MTKIPYHLLVVTRDDFTRYVQRSRVKSLRAAVGDMRLAGES